MDTIDWNLKKEELENEMNPSPIWEKGSFEQQEFATDLVNEFCEKFAKVLCWAIKDNIVDEMDINFLTDTIFSAINDIDNANWWCNKKDADEFKIASSLVTDESEKEIIKNIKKAYNKK